MQCLELEGGETEPSKSAVGKWGNLFWHEDWDSVHSYVSFMIMRPLYFMMHILELHIITEDIGNFRKSCSGARVVRKSLLTCQCKMHLVMGREMHQPLPYFQLYNSSTMKNGSSHLFRKRRSNDKGSKSRSCNSAPRSTNHIGLKGAPGPKETFKVHPSLVSPCRKDQHPLNPLP